MKRFIFATLIAAAFSFSAMPGVALAKHHHRRYHRVAYYHSAAPRSHGADVNGNVGVGLGPVHVGVGAGGGIHLHAFPPLKDPLSDPMSANDPPSFNQPWIGSQVSTNGHFIVHPSDCDLECYVNTNAALAPTSAAFVDTATDVIWASNSPRSMDVQPSSERFALSPDTSVNNYYATYAMPTVVTVGGFSVPVANDRMYFSPLRHRHGAAWHVHNEKGVDQTSSFGTSPRAGPLPESIGGSAYSVTTVEQ